MTINRFHQGLIELPHTLIWLHKRWSFLLGGGSPRIEAMGVRSLMINAETSAWKGYNINSYSPQARHIEGQKAIVSHGEE